MVGNIWKSLSRSDFSWSRLKDGLLIVLKYLKSHYKRSETNCCSCQLTARLKAGVVRGMNAQAHGISSLNITKRLDKTSSRNVAH